MIFPKFLIDKLMVVWICTLVIPPSQSQSIPPCLVTSLSTKNVDCTNADLSGLTLQQLKTLYGRAGSDIQPTTIKSVTLEKTKITDLSFLEYFRSLEQLVLREVDGLTNQHISSINKHASTLEGLTIAKISSITSIDDLQTSKLKKLAVTYCGLTDIAPRVFTNTPFTEIYDLRGNQLTSLDMSQHRSVTVVKQIIASDNKLDSITLNSFFSIEILDLSKNQLTDTSFLDPIMGGTELSRIDLSDNNLRAFQPPETTSTSKQLSKMQLLNLSGNKITALGQLGISAFKEVRNLDLSGNQQLRTLQNSLNGLSSLETLKLDNTGLREIVSELNNLGSLKELHLDHNDIVEMSSDSFLGTTNLEKLHLQNNRLERLQFLTNEKEEAQLGMLDTLDISSNYLSTLRNFVAAPKLRVLLMNANKFGSLSGCDNFQVPTTLKIVCAEHVEASMDCEYVTFWRVLKQQGVLYNNNQCCQNPENSRLCDVPDRNSIPPIEPDNCPTTEEVCKTVIIPPSPEKTTLPPVTPALARPKEREAFEALKDEEKAVIAVGYLLALIFLVLFIILFLRRYRTFEGWTKDHRDTENLKEHITRSPMSQRSGEDVVDGPIAFKAGAMGANNYPSKGSLTKSPQFSKKGMDTISIASGASHYSTLNKNTFSGRNKFKDAAAAAMEMEDRYTPQTERKQTRPSVDSADDSPTTLSVYSYASHQPESRRRPSESTPPSERRRHRSGGSIPARGIVNPGRSRSEDWLETASIDSDLVPPKILLQRKATLRTDEPDNEGNGTIVRNARSHASAPHRMKGKGRKKSPSPLLTVKQMYRNPGAPTPPMSRRALPATPDDSPLSLRSNHSSRDDAGSSGGSSFGNKKNSVFSMDDEYANDNEFVTVAEEVSFR